MIKTDFTILNWNVGGAKFLAEPKGKRENTRKKLNDALRRLINNTYNRPDVVTLQEIVQYGKSSQDAEDIIVPIRGYTYYPFPLIDSERFSPKAKWNKVIKSGKWPKNTFFAQGNAMLIRNNLLNFPVWALPDSMARSTGKRKHFIEHVHLESGLYFGDRNTEPRAARVAHFVKYPEGTSGKPLDIFVVNLHLTTLMMEREGIPEIDMEATDIRLEQLDIIFRGIISRYNMWRQQGYPERGARRKPGPSETFERFDPVWILAGDFNSTPESLEYSTMMRMNFIDVIPNKGGGTKAKGVNKPATLTVDYIFAGPKFISLDPIISGVEIKNNNVDRSASDVSDHYPLYAKIPLEIPRK